MISKSLSAIAIVVCFMFVVIGVRTYTTGTSAFERGQQAELQGDWKSAISSYRIAIEHGLVGFSYDEMAADAIKSYAIEAEDSGDRERALYVWRQLSGAWMSSESIVNRHDAEKLEAFEALKTLSATSADAMDSTATPTRPYFAMSLVLFGFSLWVLGLVFRMRSHRFAGTLAAIGLALFLAGMLAFG
ncbi:MAG: hypothetical protein R3A47_04130 [Polyangiales bacterium]